MREIGEVLYSIQIQTLIVSASFIMPQCIKLLAKRLSRQQNMSRIESEKIIKYRIINVECRRKLVDLYL